MHVCARARVRACAYVMLATLLIATTASTHVVIHNPNANSLQLDLQRKGSDQIEHTPHRQELKTLWCFLKINLNVNSLGFVYFSMKHSAYFLIFKNFSDNQ